MFQVKGNKIKYGDSELYIPNEFSNKKIDKIYGTATAGLIRHSGVLVDKRGHSGYATTGFNKARIAGHIIYEDAKQGDIVFLREQFQPNAPFNSFYIISNQKVNNDLNWINVKFDDKTILRICPFTLQYGAE